MTTGGAPASAPAGVAADEFRGASVILTGVGRRGQLGEVVASAFAEKGATVILVDRDQDAVRERAEDLGRQGGIAHSFGCDLTDPKAVGALSEEVAKVAPSGIAALVNMAGGYVDGTAVAETEPATWHKLFAINLTTAFVSTRAFLPLVRRARGSLLFFASAAALPGPR
jgi:meso-butanediol dehydrogenase/(S,S)-butanediol dehydrogenase/diacetyl reductase